MYENRYLFLGLIYSVDLIYKMYRNYISYPRVICVMAGKYQPYWYSYYTIRDNAAVHYHILNEPFYVGWACCKRSVKWREDKHQG